MLPSAIKFLPRLIFNCHPSYLDKLGLFVEQMTHSLVDNVWSSEWKKYVEINGKVVSAYFTCGATSSSLSKYINDALLTKSVSMLIMGDDTLAVDTTGSIPVFTECDYSKFDATQKDSLRELFLVYLDNSGYGDFANYWRDLYSQKIRYIHRKSGETLKVPKLEQLYTGEPGTCLRNSYTNILVSSSALTSDDPLSVYSRAGLIAKMKTGLSHYRTFLRGVFLKNTSGRFSWVRLPSFLLKFGKLLRDPLTIYSKLLSKQLRYEMCLWSQWLGYGNLRTNWFYARLHKALANLTGNLSEVEVIKDHDYMVVSDEDFYIPDEEFNAFIFDRYGLLPCVLQDYCSFVESIKIIPCRYSHFLMSVLEKIDYF